MKDKLSESILVNIKKSELKYNKSRINEAEETEGGVLDQHQKYYLETVCNFLNNTKGQIEDYEVEFLLKWLCESNDIWYNDSIPEGSVEELSGMVEDDAEDEFVATIVKYIEGYRSKDNEN